MNPRPLIYEDAVAAFVDWCNRAGFDERDRELREAFLAGIDMTERRILPAHLFEEDA